MKRLLIILFILMAVVLAGCREETIINGTPAEPAPTEKLADLEHDLEDNGGVKINEVIVNISDTEGGDEEEEDVNITDVIIEEEETAEAEDLTG